MMLLLAWGVWLVLNVFVFLLYGLDKLKAVRGKWRVPEKTLLLGTWLMGGVGAWLAMRTFRHKTKHVLFKISASAASVLSVLVMAALTLALTRGI